MKKIRLDTLLVEQGYFADADAALRAVLAHEVKVNDVYANRDRKSTRLNSSH